MAELHPPLLDELHGYAEAQGIGYEELLRGVCRRSMRLRAAMVAAPGYPEGGCSSFAVVAADGRVLAGRNYDFHSVQRVRQRLRLRPAVGRPSVGMRGSVPGGRYDGVNDRGLFISLHVALSDEPEALRPGLPFHWLPRLVLETCADTRAAVNLLTRVRHLHPFNYLVADSARAMYVVEAHPQRVRVIEPDNTRSEAGGFVAATNHFRHPDMLGFQRGRKLTHSQRRLEFLYSVLSPASGAPSPDADPVGNIAGRADRVRRGGRGVRSILTDHPSHLCGHAGGHTTLWSVTADLTAREIDYARGAPCEAEFERVDWPV